MMGRKIIVPLPGLAIEGEFDVDLYLLDIEIVTQNLVGRSDKPRMTRQAGKNSAPLAPDSGIVMP